MLLILALTIIRATLQIKIVVTAVEAVKHSQLRILRRILDTIEQIINFSNIKLSNNS